MTGGYKVPKVTVPQNDQNNFEEINSTHSAENNRKQDHVLTRSQSSNVLVIPTHSFVVGQGSHQLNPTDSLNPNYAKRYTLNPNHTYYSLKEK